MRSPDPGSTLAQPCPAHCRGFLGVRRGRGGWGHRRLAGCSRRWWQRLTRRQMGRRTLALRRGDLRRHGCSGHRILCGRRAATATTGAARWGNAQRLGEEFVGGSRPARLRRRRLPTRCRIGHASQCRSQPAGPPVAESTGGNGAAAAADARWPSSSTITSTWTVSSPTRTSNDANSPPASRAMADAVASSGSTPSAIAMWSEATSVASAAASAAAWARELASAA